MFESVVEKLLDVYLAHYVEGIKGNLHLAVWSGNVSLENLEIKKNITERLSLPVDRKFLLILVVFGKIGKLMLKIPWSGLGSSPIKIVFESVHILLTSKSTCKSDDDLLLEIRQAKEYAVSLLVANEFKNLSRDGDNQVANTSYIFRLITKILNNIQVHIKDIHILYTDDDFSLGFKLNSLSIRKCSESRYIYNQYGESYQITHSCELLQASIYCCDSVKYEEKLDVHMFDLNKLNLDESNNQVLSPLSMRLHAYINSWNKTVMATLEIGDSKMIVNDYSDPQSLNSTLESNGINVCITSRSLISFVRIANNIKRESMRKSNLLLSQSQFVACDAESLKTVTKNEYIRLYTIALSKGEMTEDEREHLQMIFDVVPIRHIAKWRSSCKKSLESLENVKSTEVTGGLWNWVKSKTASFKSSRDEYEFGGVTLDCEQMQMLKDVMNSDELIQDTPEMGSFSLSFTLAFCRFSIIGESSDSDLTFTLKNLHSNFFIQSDIDCNEMETYNIHLRLRLSQFNSIFEREILVKIDECSQVSSRPITSSWQFASLNSPFAESNPGTNNDAILVEIAHNVTKSGNVLYLGCLLSPVEIFVIPQALARLMTFIQYFYGIIQMEEQRFSFMNSYMASKGLEFTADDESVPSTTMTLPDFVPELFAFDLNVSAPIIHFYGDLTYTVEVHLGKLIAKTNGACNIDNISGIIELTETKIICAKDQDYIYFLKPVPVKTHFSVIRLINITVDIILEELFVQISPLSIKALLNLLAVVPNMRNIPSLPIRPKADDGVSIITVAQAMARSLNPNSNDAAEAAYSISCSLLVRHSGLALYSKNRDQIFVAELYNVLSKFNHYRSNGRDSTTLYVGLECASVRNPLTGALLFVVGEPKNHTIDEPVLHLKHLNIPLDDTMQSTVRTGVESLDKDDDFEDAIEEDYKSMEIDVIIGDIIKIDANLTEVEVCWQYKSVRIVYESIQDYLQILQASLPTLSAQLSTNQNPMVELDSQTVQFDHAFDSLVHSGICKNSIPLIHSDVLLLELSLRANEVAVSFLQDDNSSIGRMAAQHILASLKKGTSGDSELQLDIENGTLFLDGRCLLSAVTPEKFNILSITARFYSQSFTALPFSVCILADMSQINFIYYQNDLSRLTDYLNDGILNIFISNSYHKVLDAASKRHTLFNFNISNSCIIVPRDTDVLAGKIGARLSLPVLKYETTALVLEIGSLALKNSYPIEYKADEDVRSTITIDICKLSASLAGQAEVQPEEPKPRVRFEPCSTDSSIEPFGFIEPFASIEDTKNTQLALETKPKLMLSPVDMQIIYRGGSVINVCMHTSLWALDLTAEMLTSVINIVGENIMGNSYLQHTRQQSRHSQSAPSIFRLNVGGFFQGLDLRLPGLAEMRLDDVIICVNYFSDERPDSDAEFQCDNGYQFVWCSKTLIIDDLRNSRNVFRRLLTCSPKLQPPSFVDSIFLDSWSKLYSSKTGTDLFGSSNPVHGSKLLITSNGMVLTIEWMLNNPTISLFSVLIGEIASFFYNSWSVCSMSTHPKPVSVDTPAKTSPRRIEISCHVIGGKFVIYSDVSSLTTPKIECTTNCALSLSIDGGSYTLTRLDLEGCSLGRSILYGESRLYTCLCDQLEMYIKGKYTRGACKFASRSDFSISIPPFNINLYSRDISILASALSALNSDTTPIAQQRTQPAPKKSGGQVGLSVRLNGVCCTFLDDTRASVVPILRLFVAGTGTYSASDRSRPGWTLSCVCNNCSFKLEYLNAKVGDWEPFIERAAFEIAYYLSDIPLDPPSKSESPPELLKQQTKFNSYLMITSLLPVCVNITPHLCHLLLWLGPLLESATINNESPPKLPPKSSLVGRLHAHYAYFCLNLTPHCYYAISAMDKNSDSKLNMLVLNPGNECFPIDIIAGRGYGVDEKSNIHLIPAPPFSVLEPVLQSIFKDYPEEYIEPVLRDLMVTRSVEKTVENFKNRPQGCGVYDPCPARLGPLPIGLQSTVVSLIRNGSVPVNCPLTDSISISHSAPNEYALQTPSLYEAFKDFKSSGLDSSFSRVDGIDTTYDRQGDFDTTICHVLTPHVSHKVLLICSTVRVFNRSGLPLYVQFLDRRGKPWELPRLDITAPISVLEQDSKCTGDEFTLSGDRSSASQLLLPHGHFASVPPWVFWGPAHVNLRFRPAVELFAEDISAWSKLIGGDLTWNTPFSNEWSRVIDTHVHQGSRWRQCSCSGHKLYFLANIKSSISAFPGELELRDVTIMPAMTVLNALPLDLEIMFTGQDFAETPEFVSATSGVIRPGVSAAPDTKPPVRFNLPARAVIHIYLLTPGESLSLQLRIPDADSYWTKHSPALFLSSYSFEIRFPGSLAPARLEVVRCPVAELDKFVSLVVMTPLWLVDKTGLGIRPMRDGQLCPTIKGITLLKPSKFNEIELAVGRDSRPGVRTSAIKCQIPVTGGFGLARLPRPGTNNITPLCLNTHKIMFPEYHSHLQSRVISLVPEFMVTNDSGSDLLIRETEGAPFIRVLMGSSAALPWGPVREVINKESIELARLQFASVDPNGRPGAWSSPVYLAEQFAGVTYMGVEAGSRPAVYSLKVIPNMGVKHLCISKPRDLKEGFVLTNKSAHVKCVTIRTFSGESTPGDPGHTQIDRPNTPDTSYLTFSAKYGESIHIGWSHPFVYSTRHCQLFLWLDRKTVAPKHPLILNLSSAAFRFRQMEVTLPRGGPIIIVAQRMGSFISISVSAAAGISDDPARRAEGSCQLTVSVPQVGVSLVSHACREELLYTELSNLTAVVSLKGEHQIFELRLSDIQVDMQLEGKGGVILANRGSVQNERRYFLQLYIDRPYTSLQDVYLRKVFVAFDDLQLDIGAQIFESLMGFYRECIQTIDVPTRVRTSPEEQTFMGRLAFGNKATLLDVERWVSMESARPQSSIELVFNKPLSISLDYFYVQSCTVFVWCCFELSKLYMLGDLLRMGLRIISASNNLELKGAPVQFPQEFAINLRATAVSFYEQLKDRYTHSAISCLGGLLGYSSLVNIPRMPITLGRNTIELAADAVDNVTAGLGNILSAFTFDTEYIDRMQRERSSKSASNIREGFASAGKSIGEGVLSLTNILTKPIEGAQKSGVGGFFRGIGIGIAGSIVKPIDQVRQAVSHVSRGIKADMAKPVGGYKWRCSARRKPRMLWGEFGKLCEYNAEDADLREALGSKFSKNIMKSIVTSHSRGAKSATLLLFYPSQLLHVSLPEGGLPSVIWKIDYAAILNTRASNYGVHVETRGKTLQVPAPTVDMIYKVYTQVEDARSQATCFAII